MAKRPLPFILPAAWDERRRQRELRKYKIKPANIAKTFEADGWVLYIPTKKSFFKLPKTMIPSVELERRIRRICDYIEEYKALIDTERRAEMAAQMEEIWSMSGKEREFFGRAILGLKGRSAGRKFDFYLVRFGRDQAIETEIASGDIVLISRGEPLKSDLNATVMQVGRHFVEVAFSQKPPRWIREEGIRLDLFVNDVTFKRMETNLERMRHIEPPIAGIRDIVLELAEAKGVRKIDFEPRDPQINAAQRSAVAMGLGAEEIALIHGPPGTGKTTTIVETIVQFAERGQRILATADSNVAVDNMLEKLVSGEGLNVVRVGHPARIDTKLERYSLPSLVEKDPRSDRIKKMLDEAQVLVEARNRHSKPTPARLRGMSPERLKSLAASGRSYRGVDIKTIQSMAMWLKEDEKVERFYAAIRELERAIVDDILDGADVVLATNGMVGAEVLEGRTFDVAVVDEGSQQIEPSTLMALMRAPKAILAGDHKQLPPTVVSDLDVLKRSLFERLMAREEIPSTMLDVQYRMHEKIMTFPNHLMYDGKLKAHPSVADRRLLLRCEPRNDPYTTLLLPEHPVVFADTSALEAHEVLPPRSTSYENPMEAVWVKRCVERLIACGVHEASIGVITPYLSQVKRIRKTLEKIAPHVEVKSVDGFQGREKEVILISFVRSNIAKAIGFVKDTRRLNVAMTRARSKLIMIGDVVTLSANDPFDRLFEWLRTCGTKVELPSEDQ